MGAQLVALVLTRWTHLPDTAFRILIRMALTALDAKTEGRDGRPPNPPNLYFGGRDPLAMSLRREFPTGDSEAARKARKNIYGDVRKATAELIKAGAIELVDTGRVIRHGHAQTYRLTLAPFMTGGVLSPPSGRGDNPSSGGVLSPPEGGSTTPPRSSEEPEEERGKEERAGVGPQPQVARAHASSTKDQLCDACETVLDPDGSCFICRTPPPRRVRP